MPSGPGAPPLLHPGVAGLRCSDPPEPLEELACKAIWAERLSPSVSAHRSATSLSPPHECFGLEALTGRHECLSTTGLPPISPHLTAGGSARRLSTSPALTLADTRGPTSESLAASAIGTRFAGPNDVCGVRRRARIYPFTTDAEGVCIAAAPSPPTTRHPPAPAESVCEPPPPPTLPWFELRTGVIWARASNKARRSE